MPASNTPVSRRLNAYWRMEGANVLFVPAIALFAVWHLEDQPTVAFGLAATAACALLVLGTLYWRAVWCRLNGRAAPFDYWIPFLARAEAASIGLIGLASVAAAVDFWTASQAWTPARIATLILLLLAVLEYVNYYQIQLQHFDNMADFRRMIAGKGFRRSQMARDIAKWRSRNRPTLRKR